MFESREDRSWGGNMFKNSDPYSAMEAGEVGQVDVSAFAEKAVRQGFMRKVFGILLAQLLLTTTVCAIFMTTSGVQDYLKSNSWPLWTSMGVSFGVLIAMICNTGLARTFPHNYLLLTLFTAAESVMMGTICMMSNPNAVILAAGVTTSIVAALTLYALQTKYDFTTHGGILVGLLMAMILVGFVGIFLPYYKPLELIISGAGALLFSAFLVVDIQMLMDGKRVQVSPDDYVLGALTLYLDILNLFLYILRFINASRN